MHEASKILAIRARVLSYSYKKMDIFYLNVFYILGKTIIKVTLIVLKDRQNRMVVFIFKGNVTDKTKDTPGIFDKII